VNIGKSRDTPAEQAVDDYVRGAHQLGPLADYLVVNVSSPNTPGLRLLQQVGTLRALLQRVRAALDASSPRRRVPLLVKIDPDLPDADVDAIADLALELSLDGIIATNTTVNPGPLRSPPALLAGPGGVSGAPLKQRSLAVLRRLRARTGDRLVLISVGGIETADDVWERIRAGATLVQLYTAFIYEGPLLPRRLNEGLRQRLETGGFVDVNAAVGTEGPVEQR
jgi:dihydroorotate dehydrogenase